MLVNFQDNAGNNITDQSGNVIQFNYSGANDKLISSSITSSFNVAPFLTRQLTITAPFLNSFSISGRQTKEIIMNNFGQDPYFILTNHLGTQINDQLSTPIYFLPQNGFITTFNIIPSLSLHKLMASTIAEYFSLSAQIAHHKVLNSLVNGNFSLISQIAHHRVLNSLITSDFTLQAQIAHHRVLNSRVATSVTINNSLTRELHIAAGTEYNLNMINAIMKRIGWWDTIIIKFKE